MPAIIPAKSAASHRSPGRSLAPRHIRYLGIVTALLVPTVTFACVAKGPVDTAKWIFRYHYNFSLYRKGSGSYLSEHLLALLKRDWGCQSAGDICAMEADPWTNAQDGGVLGPIQFTLTASDGTRARVTLAYEFGWNEQGAPKPEPAKATLILIRQVDTSCWLLDDIIGPRGDSLRAQLENWQFYGKRTTLH